MPAPAGGADPDILSVADALSAHEHWWYGCIFGTTGVLVVASRVVVVVVWLCVAAVAHSDHS